MAKYDLDRIEKVELRDVWAHEALDFTKWLSQDASLNMLGDAVGVELELIETEASVGSFNVGIYAQEAGTGRINWPTCIPEGAAYGPSGYRRKELNITWQ